MRILFQVLTSACVCVCLFVRPSVCLSVMPLLSSSACPHRSDICTMAATDKVVLNSILPHPKDEYIRTAVSAAVSGSVC